MYQWSERRNEYIVWPMKNRSGVSDHEKNQEKVPGALTRRCSLSPRSFDRRNSHTTLFDFNATVSGWIYMTYLQ